MHDEMKFDALFLLKWWGAFFISATILVFATLPPFIPVEWRIPLMVSFSSICHQIPERSPHINGIALAVCHRCYGVYLGLPLAFLGFLFFKSLHTTSSALKVLLAVSLLLIAIDWGAPLLGMWHNTADSRMATGFFFGIVAGFYLLHVLHLQGAKNQETDAGGR